MPSIPVPVTPAHSNAAVLQASAERQHVRLLAQRRDLRLWTADNRTLSLGGVRDYPRGLRPDEAWVEPILRPWINGALKGLRLRLPEARSMQ